LKDVPITGGIGILIGLALVALVRPDNSAVAAMLLVASVAGTSLVQTLMAVLF
jgi:hypothetical protein